MEPHLVVTLARLREASELYRQLEDATRLLASEESRARWLASLSAEYGEDLELARGRKRHLCNLTRRLEDELHQIEARLQDRRTRRSDRAGTLMAVSSEIAALQERRDELERELLELWQQGEDTACALDKEQKTAAEVSRRLADEREALGVRCRRADQAAPEIARELSHLLRRLPRKVAGKLQQISRRHADPVADLWQGGCSACGQCLPLQEAVDIDREAALILCQGCGRYIVARSSRRTRG